MEIEKQKPPSDGPVPLHSDDSPEVESVDQLFRGGESILNETVPILRSGKKGGRPLGRKDSKQRRRPGEAERPERPERPDSVPTEADGGPARAKPGDYIQVAKLVAGIPFDLIARKTGFAGFRLEEKEIDDLAPPIDAVLVKYFPFLSASAPEMVLAASILGIAYVKYLAFLEFQKAHSEKNPATV